MPLPDLTIEDMDWIEARADELFRQSERSRGSVRPNTPMRQDHRDHFLMLATWERAREIMSRAG